MLASSCPEDSALAFDAAVDVARSVWGFEAASTDVAAFGGVQAEIDLSHRATGLQHWTIFAPADSPSEFALELDYGDGWPDWVRVDLYSGMEIEWRNFEFDISELRGPPPPEGVGWVVRYHRTRTPQGPSAAQLALPTPRGLPLWHQRIAMLPENGLWQPLQDGCLREPVGMNNYWNMLDGTTWYSWREGDVIRWAQVLP